jgi:hypothetical protein
VNGQRDVCADERERAAHAVAGEAAADGVEVGDELVQLRAERGRAGATPPHSFQYVERRDGHDEAAAPVAHVRHLLTISSCRFQGSTRR